jgi:hypothetical protein
LSSFSLSGELLIPSPTVTEVVGVFVAFSCRFILVIVVKDLLNFLEFYLHCYQLSFTFVANKVKNDAKAFAAGKVLGSIGKENVSWIYIST